MGIEIENGSYDPDHTPFFSPAKKNKWVLNKAGVKRELLDTVNARKLAYNGHTIRKQGSCLEREIMQGTMSGVSRRGKPRMAWMVSINTWTGLSVEESVRMTQERDKWRSMSMMWPTLGSRTAKEQNGIPLVVVWVVCHLSVS